MLIVGATLALLYRTKATFVGIIGRSNTDSYFILLAGDIYVVFLARIIIDDVVNLRHGIVATCSKASQCVFDSEC